MTYEQFISCIESADVFERLDALDTLGMEADETTLARVAGHLMADPDPGVREEAGRLLETLATPEAAAQAVPYIASADIALRNFAGEVLVQIGVAAVDALVPAVDDPHRDVRKFAIDVLAQLPARHVAGCIATHLDDPDDNVVLAAVDALGALGAVEYVDALRALYDRQPLARPGIVAALGVFGSEADLGFLEHTLADEDPVVQYTAAEALAQQNDPEVMDLLLRKVNQVDPMARPVVVSSIITFNDSHPGRVELPEAIKGYLLEMLEDFDLDYRCAAARGLSTFLDDEAVDGLMAQAGQEDTLDVEMFGVLAAYPDVFHRIVVNVDAGRVTANDAAGFILGFLAQQIIPEDDIRAVGDFLVAHFRTLDAETKVAAIGLCQSLQHPDLEVVIYTGIADPDTEVNGFAADAAHALGLDPSWAA